MIIKKNKRGDQHSKKKSTQMQCPLQKLQKIRKMRQKNFQKKMLATHKKKETSVSHSKG